ncbi:ribosomal RNA small subunit methyltransferase B, partial [Vibrio parahaemolyticus AQ3810]
HVGQ